MSESEKIIEATAIVPSQMQLGSLPIRNPKDLVAKATEMADALAGIITQQNLFKNINGRKYVMVEGWTTLGAMMGVVPVEEYCHALPLDESGMVTGFEAKVKLIRAGDGGMVGAASAECTYDEKNWSDRDSYAVRSMSITRATGKAYRLSFSWIMKLAGFEPTPAEEMDGVGSKEAQQTVATEKLRKSAGDDATVTLTPWKEGRLALSGTGLAIIRANLDAAQREALGIMYSTVDKVTHMPAANGFALVDLCEKHQVGTVWMNAPERPDSGVPKANLPPFKPLPPQNGGQKSNDPVIVSAKRARAGAKEFLAVEWDGKKLSCWHKSMWAHLEHHVNRPAVLNVVPNVSKKDGKEYLNIEGIVSLDGEEFFSEPVGYGGPG